MFNVDENGNITLTQGDSGELVVNGLPTDKNYRLYLAVQDEKRNPIGGEIDIETNNSPTITFVLPADFTDLFVVPKNEESATYYYGIKLCDPTTQREETLILGGQADGDRAIITAYPKQVEGL